MASTRSTRATPVVDHPSSTPSSAARSNRSRSVDRPTTTCRSRHGHSPSSVSTSSQKGVVNDISHEGLRLLLREEGVSFHVVNTFKRSNDPDYEAKKNRILHLYNLADGKIDRQRGVRRGLRLVDRPALRTHQEGPHPVPRVLPLPAHPAPAPCSDRDRARQLLATPVDQEGPTRQRVGSGEQRRTRLHPVLRVMAEPDRSPV